MAAIRQTILTGIFFVAVGSVYNASANGQSPLEAVTAALQGAPAQTAAATADAVKPSPALESGVKVSSYDTVSLNVANADLAQVLQLLSIQGRRNIVPSSSVKGSVTANLYDVTFYQALDAILQQNGCGYREKGNFIYIYTADELKKIEQAERKVAYKVVKLNYITASDAATFVTPLLSSAGSIAVSGNVGPGFVPSTSDGGANSYAHPDTMVVRDYPENITEIEKVLKELDQRPKQVLVEATILKADLTESTAFGVDFSVLSNVALDAFTNPFSAINELAGNVTGGSATHPSGTTSAIQSTVGNAAAGQGGVKVGIVTNNVAAFIRALDTVTDTTIIANPKIMALNRQRADVLVGQKVGYLSTTATATATTQTVEFLDTGTQLSLRPFISDDGFIRLELKPSISSATIRSVVPGTDTAAVTVPDEDTQELTTNVMVQDGQTIVLGGLFKEETTTGRSQIPLLGDIPIAGAAFKGKDDSVKRSEVIFLITTHILKDKALIAGGEAAKDATEMARIGVREGLLPWSRSKMTAAHLREALKAIDAGDRDKALYQVDLALSLDPTQVEAIRLKEKLTGQRTYWPDRSMLDEAVSKMVETETGVHAKPISRPTVPDPRPSHPSSDNEPLFPVTPDVTPSSAAPATQQPAAEQSEQPTPAAEEPATEQAAVEPAAEVKAEQTAAPVQEVTVTPAVQTIEAPADQTTEPSQISTSTSVTEVPVTEPAQQNPTDEAPATEPVATEPADAAADQATTQAAADEPAATEPADAAPAAEAQPTAKANPAESQSEDVLKQAIAEYKKANPDADQKADDQGDHETASVDPDAGRETK